MTRHETSINGTTRTTYVLADHLGSPDVTVDSTGSITHQSFDAFGQA